MQKYEKELAKILYNAKRDNRWGLALKNEVINSTSSSTDILDKIGLLTVDEFNALTNDFENLELKVYNGAYPYENIVEENGIYIEECSPMKAMIGRLYVIVDDNKKMVCSVESKNEKHESIILSEYHEDGIYLFSFDSGEIRFVSNEKLQELCAYNRTLLHKGIDELSDEEIIQGLTHSSKLIPLFDCGIVVANGIDMDINEENANYLFRLGIKEYMRLYPTGVSEKYESEIPEVMEWHR